MEKAVDKSYIITFTGRVLKFGRFWRFSSIFSIINEQICIKLGVETGGPLIYYNYARNRKIRTITSVIFQ